MTSSEIAFLAVGLVFGAALGAALAQVVRARPGPRREVRLTITPNAIPTRRTQGVTVQYANPSPAPRPIAASSIPPATPGGSPGTGGAAAPAGAGGMDGTMAPSTRTRVPSGGVVLPATAVGVPVGAASVPPVAGIVRDSRQSVTAPQPSGNPVQRASAMTTGAGSGGARGYAPDFLDIGAAAVAVLEAPSGSARGAGPGRVPATLDATARPKPFTTLVRPRRPVEAPRLTLAPGAVPVADRPAARIGSLVPLVRPILAPPSGPTLTRPRAGAQSPRWPANPGSSDASSVTGGPGAAADPCAGQRRAVEERCALADVAREQARRVADALREAQRAYDILRERVDRAEALADPRHVAAAKERLHAEFRAASDRAKSAEETEAAARAWLNEINALNNAVRDAQRTVESGTAELRSRVGALERLSAEADAARIAGENAESGCREAREDLAGCEEADARARSQVPPEPVDPHPFADVWPVDSPNLPGRPGAGDQGAGLPLVVRLLRGDRGARERLVATLAAGDPDAARDWGLRVARLADAIIGRAIEDGYLDLPEDDPFWRLFSYHECRDIVGALSALGFRYDGMGGFADGRAPAARDLSLAVGYAGLDRMRIRTWPRDAEIATMYARVVVAADQWLADQAGDLSLGRMVDALGNRAADLADVWNAWGRVRPALLSD